MTNALQTAPARPYVKQFDCPSCGASVTIRTPGRSLVASCGSCGSLADVTDENYQIISSYYTKARLTPLIELGTRGKLNGKSWEVIGLMERSDASDNNFSWSDEDSSPVTWQEYLLFNPRYGYRWLLQSDGHWNLIYTSMKQPEMLTELFPASKRRVKLDNRVYKCFFQGRARVTYVLGEFYWRVQVGETAEVEDYIAPPYLLSQELTDAERVWSVGEYISPESIKEAFGLADDVLPKPKGVAPNQVWPKRQQFQFITAIWIATICLLLTIQIMVVNAGQTENAFEQTYPLAPNVVNSEPITTPSFELKAGLATTRIGIETMADNSSISIDGELVNETSGAVFHVEKSLSITVVLTLEKRGLKAVKTERFSCPPSPADVIT